MTTLTILKQFPGIDGISDDVLNFALDGAYMDNSVAEWGQTYYDRAVTLQALAVSIDLKSAAFGASGPVASMSRGMGSSASLSFASPDSNTKGWERNTYGLQYVALRNRVFAGGAMAIERDEAPFVDGLP